MNALLPSQGSAVPEGVPIKGMTSKSMFLSLKGEITSKKSDRALFIFSVTQEPTVASLSLTALAVATLVQTMSCSTTCVIFQVSLHKLQGFEGLFLELCGSQLHQHPASSPPSILPASGILCVFEEEGEALGMGRGHKKGSYDADYIPSIPRPGLWLLR